MHWVVLMQHPLQLLAVLQTHWPPEQAMPPVPQAVPDAMGEHIPVDPILQAWQVGQVDVAQQIPFTQFPVPHSMPAAHAWPSVRATQVVPMQTGRLAGQSLALQQWEAVPVPPPVQISTHVLVAGSHFRFVPHVLHM